MPELPSVTIYVERLAALTTGSILKDVRLRSPFLLRSVSPKLDEAKGKVIQGYRRIGKRIIFELEDDLFLVVHLMVAGRLRWRKLGAAVPGKRGLAAFDFVDRQNDARSGTVIFTEASKKKRASLYVVLGEKGLAEHDRGGIEVIGAKAKAFREALTRENRTLKRALTDPRIFSGIGNAYSDEILHRARLSPVKLTSRLTPDDIKRLHKATKSILTEWTQRLREEVGDGFPDKVTAFRDEFAVHGKYRQPCPDCGSPVQRIRYAENEVNYCAVCQNQGKLLADRALSRLLKKDWPRTLDELEERRSGG